MKNPHAIDSTPAGLRKFGFTMAGLFCFLGLISLRHHAERSVYFAIPAVIFLALVLIRPGALRISQKLWMGLAFHMGAVMTKVLMCLIYFGLVTPLALLAKLTGRDFLREKSTDKNTYWIPSSITKENKEAYLRQF